MTKQMKQLIKDAIYELSQGSSEQLLLSMNLDTELHKNRTFMELIEE